MSFLVYLAGVWVGIVCVWAIYWGVRVRSYRGER